MLCWVLALIVNRPRTSAVFVPGRDALDLHFVYFKSLVSIAFLCIVGVIACFAIRWPVYPIYSPHPTAYMGVPLGIFVIIAAIVAWLAK